MRTSKVVHVVSCHAEGEVGDVIVGGVAPPLGGTVWEQSRFILSSGQSGHLFSPYYADQTALWRDGQTIGIHLKQDQAAPAGCLVLDPTTSALP